MLEAGVDAKIVAEPLGHSDTRVTREVYQHVLPQIVIKAAEATARMVPRGGANEPGPSLSGVDTDRLLGSREFAARLGALGLQAETFVEQLANTIRATIRDSPGLSHGASLPRRETKEDHGAEAAEAAAMLVPLHRPAPEAEEKEAQIHPPGTVAHATLTPEGAKIIAFPSGRVRG